MYALQPPGLLLAVLLDERAGAQVAEMRFNRPGSRDLAASTVASRGRRPSEEHAHSLERRGYRWQTKNGDSRPTGTPIVARNGADGRGCIPLLERALMSSSWRNEHPVGPLQPLTATACG